MRQALPPYLRSLWNIAPALLDFDASDGRRPFVSALGVHLPRHAPGGSPRDAWFQAASAHAAAHLVFSPHRFAVDGLRPVTQAILGALEDARVEWLASRELPGLRRLWLRFHAVDTADDASFEGLLRRLAHALLDPGHTDPHPWVQKARQFFFVDEAGEMLALRQPGALRDAASRLGHDIGQMRLQFNARLYRVWPDYRDDNTCLWLGDDKRADTVHELAGTPAGSATTQPTPPETASETASQHRVTYPEWDRLVPMYRPDWCSVLDDPTPLADTVRRPPQAHQSTWRYAQAEGDEFDLDALIETRISPPGEGPALPRVYARRSPAVPSGATLLLIDTSASTEVALPAARELAMRCARLIERSEGSCAIHSFCSDGRHAVHYTRVKEFDERLGPESASKLTGLRSRLSTRLGAALRHATRLITERGGPARRIVLLTDGKPHDVDVHDPRYLMDDARQAVREAARAGVIVRCLSLDARELGALKRVFGTGRVHGPGSFAAAVGP